MRIAIVGGREVADYLTGLLKANGHRIVLVQEERERCEYLSAKYDMPVVLGDPCREEVLADAGIRGCSLLIALKAEDADNLEICQMAKRLFDVEKTACFVANPANAAVFEHLGVDRVMNIAQILASYVEQEAV